MDRGAGVTSAAASRAERFEDEKRRIIESCFSKREPDGSLIETYITHIRITEYSQHPSSPPPPEARTAESEKPRIIIVAVRRSGRVRMHKSKENTSGTFSIGKTWNLDDLSQIESFTGPQVGLSYREWAGDTGFIVTLGKQYFWQAQTDKEKKFFVASLIKIFGKYTGGKVPELTGFDPRELDQVLGAGRRPTASSARSPGVESVASSVASPSTLVPTPSSGTPEPSRLQKSSASRPLLNGTGSPAPSSDSVSSKDRVAATRWAAQTDKSQDAEAYSMAHRRDDASHTSRSRNGIYGVGASARYGESRESSEQPQDVPARPPSAHPDERPPPERRRPPMDPSRPQDRDLVPPPLVSSNVTREPIPPPPKSTKRLFNGDGIGLGWPLHASRDQDAAKRVVKTLNTNLREVSPKSDPIRGAKGASTSSATEALSPTELSLSPDPPDQDESRPGLGPMIKAKRSKGDIAGALWKAASAATAFRPRPGGAGDRLRQTQSKADGPDGITSVVPAPSRPVSRDPRSESTDALKPTDRRDSNDVKADIPTANISRAASAQPSPSEEKSKQVKKEVQKEEQAARSVVAGNDVKYLQSLGIDPSILDGRSEEFGKWLDHFGWVPGQQMRTQTMDDIKTDIERELNKAQAGGWLARFQEEDERVDAIKRGIDLAISECDEMDNLLTLYAVELSTLSEDISYIEAQGQGLQVQTANQKLLRRELESLLETCAITSNDLEALRIAPLEKTRGLEDVESSLVTLFRAMTKMDPTLGGHEVVQTAAEAKGGGDSDPALGLNSDYGNMRIVQEKKQMYMQESAYFMRRLIEFMARQFDEAFSETQRCLDGATSNASSYDAGRDLLWRYSPLMLYARDVDLDNWNRLLQIYQDKSHPLYMGQIQNVVAVLRRNARKLTGDEADLLFSSQLEKHQEGGVATTARKLTVKRSQTLARALRSPLDGRTASTTTVDKANREGGCHAYEVFSSVLDEVLPLVEMEQNFIIDFFHATTLEQVDFPDAVAACLPRDRRGGDLRRHRLMEPDRDLARRVTRSMEVIFAFLESELQRLMDWVLGQDALQGVGVLAVLEKKLLEMSRSNQDYVNTLLQKLHGVLESRFRKFVDEQIRAIEETKVKVNKRKGVISFIRVFPAFATAIESMMTRQEANMALRRTVDREYERILKSMFDSLMVIAREHPTVTVTSGGADAEDKEALNFHILLIENMNHFMEETETRGLELLEEWKEQAKSTYHEHMGLYVNAVMRRPLGKLLDQLENIEAQLQMGKLGEAIARQPSNSSATFNKMLGSYEAKEVRKGIEALRKRVEKHFGDADDPGLSRGLVLKVTRECEVFYGQVESRIGRVTTEVYGGEVPYEWPRAETPLRLRQQTLTQIDFVSSFEEDEDDEEADDDRHGGPEGEGDEWREKNKQKRRSLSTKQKSDYDDDGKEDQRRKKRKTQEEGTTRRRYTVGEGQGESNQRNHQHLHTQTLTQLLGVDAAFVADSDADSDGDGEEQPQEEEEEEEVVVVKKKESDLVEIPDSDDDDDDDDEGSVHHNDDDDDSNKVEQQNNNDDDATQPPKPHRLPLESQRVPAPILRSMPPPTPRTDILLPFQTAPLISGRTKHIDPKGTTMTSTNLVVRIWFLDGGVLRHMACVDQALSDDDEGKGQDQLHGKRRQILRIRQMYELNDAVSELDMRREAWIPPGPMLRHHYLPPAVVGQLLWNLRQALFDDDDDDDDDFTPSSPIINGPPMPSSSSIAFLDHGASHVSLSPEPDATTNNNNKTPLLTRSQMLPESLLHDHGPSPPRLEICDSEDDDDLL
ncbi:hypothetical protein L249_8541 [Ophiocordyceps polyrhachis-furcata BCC 54312]|uniref:Exocyst complex component Sec3 PIP2-binding N-terminal domain-containing protein n=1 Tax=Ophiocordyceps polyrhachis-furcata BCC 54312 TaxID=1330021 RepID=A0A367L6M0_9HYPO|nr:hypothetical protein L249_8541 [Ophiocordyceps polyrhachis-furcata BCC 54312]